MDDCSYFLGEDLDRASRATEDSRDSQFVSARSSRAQALAEGMKVSRFSVAGGVVTHPTARRSNILVPIVNSCLSESEHLDGLRDKVATGFGRYVDYTQVAAVAGGAWVFLPLNGGVRVAIPRSSLQGKSADYAARLARSVAAAPARYGFIMQGDTLVPSSLGPGDRHVLASSADVF